MNSYNEICVAFSNFVKKIIGGITFAKKQKICKDASLYHLLKSKEIKHL